MDDQKPEPKASASDVRVLGAFFVVTGLVAAYFGRGWYLEGTIPAEWFFGFEAVLGIVLIIVPEPFRRRASRFNELGEAISRKKK